MIYRVGTFTHDRGPGRAPLITAYSRDYSLAWDGCVEYEIDAASAAEARRMARSMRRRAEAETFNAELKHLIVTQKAAFNSPVWFNIGVPGVPQQASACFILSVDDEMDSILNWYVEEGTIFKGGSGAGVNLSRIRASVAHLKGGGTASGPVSFMRGADASAGTIKSGGKTRRAAKMVILDVDHPDIAEFVWVKAREEENHYSTLDNGLRKQHKGKMHLP